MFTTLTAIDGSLLHAFWQGPLSNWAPRAVRIDGETYSTGEKRIMIAKALAFGDLAAAQAMRRLDDPKALKTLGRDVKGFQQSAWDALRPVISRDLLLHKLTQHPDILRTVLSAPQGRFVEASPYDRLWGVKLGIGDPACATPRNGRG